MSTLTRPGRRLVFGGMVLCLLGLLGCSSSNPSATRYYLLTDPQPGAVVPSSATPLSLAELTLPMYLQSRNMAVVAGNTQVRGARGHRWAEPLADGVRRYLEDALAPALEGVSTLRLDVLIRHLHGSEAGTVVLDLSWRIRERGSEEPLQSGRFSDSLEQERPGYEALVLAHRLLLQRFVDYVEGAAGGLANQKQQAPSSEAPAMIEKPNS
ncbi:MAG: PqiC family protein [Pseudomonadales bacterium]